MKKFQFRTLLIYTSFVVFGFVSIHGIASAFISPSVAPPTAIPTETISGARISGNIPGNAANVTGMVGVTNGGTGTSSAFSAGSVIFTGVSGVYSQDNTNLYWDDANNRLGVGTATPAVRLHVSDTNDSLLQLQRATAVNPVIFREGTNSALVISVGGGDRLTILSTGNVGVGTTNPGELLSLGLTGTTKGVISLAGNTSGKIIIQPADAAGTYTLTLPIAQGAAGTNLQNDGAGNLSWAPGTAGTSSIVFSNGSDGDVTISSNTSLSRDWHYNNLTVNGGVTLNTNGYRVLVANTLTNNGTIENSGGAGGTLAAGGAGGGGGCGSAGAQYDSCYGCGVPGAGASKNPSLGSSAGNGGNGSGCSNAGTGGTATSEQAQIVKQVIPTSTNLPSGGETVITSVGDLNYLLVSGATSGITGSTSAGGGGGGGGSGDADGGPGGGGGTGGGIVFVSAQTLSNSGTIRALGGNGGGGSCGYAGVFPGGGGGGGGGGGAVVLFYKTLPSLGTINVAGGSAGNGNTCGGQPGTAGVAGKIYRAKITF